MLSRSKGIAIFVVSGFLLAVCIFAGYFGIGVTHQERKGQPNIVAIIVDDLGWNDVSFHGANQIPTPNIDALAAYGVTLQRHYTLPICTPSRTSYLTGYHAIRTGMQGYPLRAGEPRGIPLNITLLPEHLRNLGYSTHLLGKWHVGYYTKRHTPAYRGFDTFFGYYSGYIQYFNHTILQDGHTGYDLHRDVRGNLTVEYNYKYMTDLITEKAVEMIHKHDEGKPLYLQISHLAPHSSDADDPLEVRDIQEMNHDLGYIQDSNRRKFAGLVRAVDESVGKVMEALKKTNMLKNTVIVFMSDNGAETEGLLRNYGSNYPLRGQKYTLWEGGIRGVACVYSPLLKQPSRISNRLFHVTDWLPTFYAAAGGDPKTLHVDGVNQWEILLHDSEPERGPLLFNIDEVKNNSAAVYGRFKLIQGRQDYLDYYGDSGNNESYPRYDPIATLNSKTASAITTLSKYNLTVTELLTLRNKSRISCEIPKEYPKCLDSCLFDIQEDPCETNDLSAKYPQIVQQLRKYIESYKKVLIPQTNAPVDPASYPQLHNGVWVPWIPDRTTF